MGTRVGGLLGVLGVGGVREGKGRGDTSDGVTLAHTNTDAQFHSSPENGTKGKIHKTHFSNTRREGDVLPYTSKQVNPEKHQHHDAVTTDHITKSTVRAKKNPTSQRGRSREVFLTLPLCGADGETPAGPRKSGFRCSEYEVNLYNLTFSIYAAGECQTEQPDSPEMPISPQQYAQILHSSKQHFTLSQKKKTPAGSGCKSSNTGNNDKKKHHVRNFVEGPLLT